VTIRYDKRFRERAAFTVAEKLTRRFSYPIIRRFAVNVVHSHVCRDSFFHQLSRCCQHEIIPLAIIDSLLRFLLCLVDADRSASVVINNELRAMGRHSVHVSHSALESEYKPSGPDIVV